MDIEEILILKGHGPQREVDQLLAAHAEKIGCVFVDGKTALFIQLRDVLSAVRGHVR